MNLSEAIKQFGEWRGISNSCTKGEGLILRQFALYMRNCGVEDVTDRDITEYIQSMLDLGWHNNSMIPRANSLRKFFEWLELKRYEVVNPRLIPVPKKEYSKTNIAQEEDVEKILSVMVHENSNPRQMRNISMVKMLWDTGARNSELCSLDVDDIDLKNKKAVIKTKKSRGLNPYRPIFWTEETNNYLSQWIDKKEELQQDWINPSNALFVSIGGGRVQHKNGQRITNKGVAEMLRRYSHKADIGRVINAHSFRHHLGHHLTKKGANNSTISSILGHSALQSSYRYTQLENKEAEEVYRDLMK